MLSPFRLSVWYKSVQFEDYWAPPPQTELIYTNFGTHKLYCQGDYLMTVHYELSG